MSGARYSHTLALFLQRTGETPMTQTCESYLILIPKAFFPIGITSVTSVSQSAAELSSSFYLLAFLVFPDISLGTHSLLFRETSQNLFHFSKLDRAGESLAVHNKERSTFNPQLLSELNIFLNCGIGGGAVAIGVEFI